MWKQLHPAYYSQQRHANDNYKESHSCHGLTVRTDYIKQFGF